MSYQALWDRHSAMTSLRSASSLPSLDGLAAASRSSRRRFKDVASLVSPDEVPLSMARSTAGAYAGESPWPLQPGPLAFRFEQAVTTAS